MDISLSTTKPVKVLMDNGSVISGIPLDAKPEDVDPAVWENNIDVGNLPVQDGKLTWFLDAKKIQGVGQW